jgi:hypothetical protein
MNICFELLKCTLFCNIRNKSRSLQGDLLKRPAFADPGNEI